MAHGEGVTVPWPRRMTRRVAWVCLLVLLGSPAACWAEAAGSPTLIVQPTAGHAGDLFFLSGGSFAPHTKLTFLIGCPNAKSESPHRFLLGSPGPVTDAHGHFVAFPMRVTAMPVNKSRPCRIYASQRGRPYSPGDPPLYKVFANDQSLPSCATQICLTVSQGFQGRGAKRAYAITIRGWPGMALRAILMDGHGAMVGSALTTIMPWNGKVMWRLSPAMTCGPSLADASIHIDGHLGPTAGSYNGSFAPPCGGHT